MKNLPVPPPPRAKWEWLMFMFLTIFSFAIIIFLNSEADLFNVASKHLHKLQSDYYNSNLRIQNGTVSNISGFAAYMLELPWEKYTESYHSKNFTDIFTFYEIVFRHLQRYLVKPPKTPINSSCSPLPPYSAAAFNCSPLAKAPKIGILLQFGFDADILEIYFREMCDIVDNFFVLQSTKSYFRGLSKPLLWPLLREQHRFEFCKNKVVHFIIDDSDVVEEMKKFQNESIFTNYELETLQERRRWEKFLIWNNSTKVYKRGDFLGFGDSDEIPSRRNVEFLKTCKINVDILDVGVWFPYGRISQAFKTDFPVHGHPFTYGDPAFWKFEAAISPKPGSFPNRRRGSSGAFLLGGVHFTFYGYLPFVVAKMLSSIEQNSNTSAQLIDLPKRLKQENIRALEESLSRTPDIFKNRIKTLEQWKNENEDEYKKIVVFPWFYDCNKPRYPAWEGKHDNRLD